MLNNVEIITTEYETTLKNLSSPSITSKRADCKRIVSGTITSLNLRIRKVREPFINAVKKVNGKSTIRIRRNLFIDTFSTFLIFVIKTKNKRKESEKKNIL